MRALVIGGTGFVGLNVVDELLAEGATVRVSRRKQSVTAVVRRRPVELVEASLEEGVRGVRNVCEAALAAKVPRLVYTSTIATLHTVETRPAHDDDVPPEMPVGSVYRGVKWAMEREVERAQDRGLDAVTLLPGGCIGPGDLRVGTASVIVGVVRGLMTWWVDGKVNLVDVGDAARAHVAAAKATPHRRYALAGSTVCVKTLLRTVARQVVSNARAEAELGFAPRPLEESLDRAHAWLTRFGLLPKRTTEAEKGHTHEHS